MSLTIWYEFGTIILRCLLLKILIRLVTKFTKITTIQFKSQCFTVLKALKTDLSRKIVFAVQYCVRQQVSHFILHTIQLDSSRCFGRFLPRRRYSNSDLSLLAAPSTSSVISSSTVVSNVIWCVSVSTVLGESDLLSSLAAYPCGPWIASGFPVESVLAKLCTAPLSVLEVIVCTCCRQFR